MKILPNLLSIFRIILVPLFIAAYMLDEGGIKYTAIGIFLLASLSDVLDGYIARRFDAQSSLGKVLDPLGDKLMNFSVLVCITITIANPVFVAAVCIYFIKEALMGIGGLIIHKKTDFDIPPSNILGKTATVVLFLTCLTLLVWRSINGLAADILICVAIGLTLAAFARYIYTYANIMKASSKTGGSGAPDTTGK